MTHTVSRRSAWSFGLIAGLFVLWAPTSAGARETNVIKKIKAAQSRDIEVELTSTKPFPVRDNLIEIEIGNRRFARSKPAPDGSLNTIIFIVDANSYARTKNGDRVKVGFRGEPAQWDFGNLDKSRRGAP